MMLLRKLISAVSNVRPGSSLLETLLFLCIVAIMSTTMIAVFIASQDARVRQQSIAALEQQGAEVLQQITRRIRRSEAVITPLPTKSGAILALQSGLNSEQPTLFTVSGGNLMMIEKVDKSYVLLPSIKMTGALFTHVTTGSLVVSFDLSTTFPTPKKTAPYKRHFEGSVTIFPDDQAQTGGCGTCPAPTCTSHKYRWYYCESGLCALSADSLAC